MFFTNFFFTKKEHAMATVSILTETRAKSMMIHSPAATGHALLREADKEQISQVLRPSPTV